jgi:hypothetical protein
MATWDELEQKYGQPSAAAPAAADPWAALEQKYAMPEAPRGYTYSEGPDLNPNDPNRLRIETAGTNDPNAAVGSEAPAGGKLSRTDKFQRGLRDPIDAGAQLLANALPSGIVKAGDEFNNWLSDKTGVVGRLPEGGVDQQVRDATAAYAEQRKAGGESGFDGYRVLGNVLNPANLAAAAKLPQAASLIGRIGVGAGFGGATGTAFTPVESGDFWQEKRMQGAVGALAGGAFPAVAGAISRGISPKSSLNPNLQLLKKEGVRPTIGQTMGGKWNALEEKMQSLPIMGDAIASARGRSLAEFNTAAINRATKPIGEKIEGTGQRAVMEAGDKLGAAYDNLLPKMSFKPDAQFAAELNNVRQMAASGLAPKEAAKFDSILNEHLSKLSPNGSMRGETFKVLESQLRKDADRFSKSNDAYQQELGGALNETLRIFRDTLPRSNPKFAEDLKKINSGYANLVRVEGAAKGGKNSEGVFTPGQLNSAVQQSDQSVRKRAVSRGTALMQDLGNAGQAVIGNKVPNSFTTDRALIAGGALGSYLINPTIPLGLLGGAAMYSKPAQSLLGAAISSRPQAAKPVADALEKYASRLLPLSTQVGLGLLN